MADSDRPRPRPRPRPKPKALAPVTAATTPEASSSTLFPSSPPKPVPVHDEDEMFMRNRGRSTKTWETLEILNKETKPTYIESDSDEGTASPRRQKKRKGPTPAWQGNKALDRLMSADLSDGSDGSDDIEFLGSSETPRTKQPSKRKRLRTRSRSITPPPALPLHQLQNARALVEQTLNTAPRPASPTNRDDDDDATIFMNPELARIAKTEATRSHSVVPASSPPPENTDTVELTVKWQPHPLNEAGKEAIWVFKMNRDDNFRDLFEATAEEASILSESLILSYKGKRIFSSVTPMALHIYDQAELVACDKTTYDYIRQNPPAAAQSLSAFDAMSPAPDAPSDTEAPFSSQQDTDAESDSEGGTFKLILRSTISAKDITLTVRPTTKCGAIVKAFLKKAGVVDQYPGVFEATGAPVKKGAAKKGAKAVAEKDPRLCVDGDKMGNDVEIGEADLEDGDLVEVVGL